MRVKIVIILILISLLPSFSTTDTRGYLTVNITGIRNTDGVIRLAFFTDQKSFEKEAPKFTKTLSKERLKDGNITVRYRGVLSGTYGIALLDDENENGDMDYRIGIPTEGFGFSNYYHTGMKKPTFDKFSFYYDGGVLSVSIKVRYIL